jgi:hypothetical protein
VASLVPAGGPRVSDNPITTGGSFVEAIVSMKEMVVRTRQSFRCPPSTVWSLMCNSQMDGSASLLFKLGVPQPVQCNVTDRTPGVGSERECVSDQGVVHQRILVWKPGSCLSFRMESTDMPFRRYVRDLVDTFDLRTTNGGVDVTRTTQVWTQGRFQIPGRFALYFSLRKVHRYVFRNWVRLANEVSSSVTLESGSSSAPTA